MEDKYIIVELIPTASNPKSGSVIQVSALKIDNLQLIDRFDYRLNEDYIPLTEMIHMISYDKEQFVYKETSNEIMNAFRKWVEDYPLLILNNSYTLAYLREFPNIKKDIGSYLHISYTDHIIDDIMKKYHLEPSNHIVDLLYEALIYESNNQSKKK